MTPMSNEDIRSTFDIAETKTPVGFFKALFRLTDATREGCIPAVVVQREDERGLIRVLPIAKTMKQTKDKLIGENKKPLWVRPFKIFHGGFHIHAPLFIGDTGYLIAIDRDCMTAIQKNEKPVEKDGNLDELKEKNTSNPDDLTPQRYNYGFFLPCSWVLNDGELLKEHFNRDEGTLKDKFVVSNGKKIDEDESCYITISREGVIEIHSTNSLARVSKEAIDLMRRDSLDDGEYNDEDGNTHIKNSSVVRSHDNGVEIGRYDGDGNSSVVRSHDNGVEMGRYDSDGKRNVLEVNGDKSTFSNEKLSAEIDLNKLKSSASFREVRIITGEPSRDGDTVTIPTSTIRVLCDEPIQSEPLTFSVKDSQ